MSDPSGTSLWGTISPGLNTNPSTPEEWEALWKQLQDFISQELTAGNGQLEQALHHPDLHLPGINQEGSSEFIYSFTNIKDTEHVLL